MDTTEEDPRVALVKEHVRLENLHDFPGCIAKFSDPNYEVIPTDEDYPGADGVEEFLLENKQAFPDFYFTPSRIEPATNVVVVEGHFTGTHLGLWRGLPATGKKIDVPMCILFEFDGPNMIKEKLYFDMGEPLRQLGVADNPNSTRGKITMLATHPLVIIKALLRGIGIGR